jgi:hypothetical protein
MKLREETAPSTLILGIPWRPGLPGLSDHFPTDNMANAAQSALLITSRDRLDGGT